MRDESAVESTMDSSNAKELEKAIAEVRSWS